ncbi:MAG TPA: hypothetical protein VGN63_20440 [Flavisolibacter sp.]|jgi:hypothetical protein|nr:hypothetical protein [Flavisolibacter sp.]
MRTVCKRHFIFSLVIVSVSILQYACSGTRNAMPSKIGLLPLEAYDYTGSNPEADTVFRVIQNEIMFDASFRATSASARQPAFQGQTVVAIVMRAAPPTPLHFSRAEVSGTAINVYAETCTGCDRTRAVVATIPNVGNVRLVRFFIGGESKASINL